MFIKGVMMGKKRYYERHKEQIIKKTLEYYHLNREKRLIQMRRYYQNHKEKMKIEAMEWTKNHPNKVKEIMHKANRKYRETHPDIIRVRDKKHEAKRRELGFIPLNQSFEGAIGHHINKSDIVYIPKSIHDSVRHNVWTGDGMEEINIKVFDWLGENYV